MGAPLQENPPEVGPSRRGSKAKATKSSPRDQIDTQPCPPGVRHKAWPHHYHLGCTPQYFAVALQCIGQAYLTLSALRWDAQGDRPLRFISVFHKPAWRSTGTGQINRSVQLIRTRGLRTWSYCEDVCPWDTMPMATECHSNSYAHRWKRTFVKQTVPRRPLIIFGRCLVIPCNALHKRPHGN